MSPTPGVPTPGSPLFRRLNLPAEQERSTGAEALPGVRVVVQRYTWVLLGALIGLTIGGVAAVVRPPTYTSTAYLSVSTTNREATALDAARAAQALARIATAPSVVSGPLRSAGLTRAADRPQLSIASQAAPDAPLVSITGTDSSAARAQQIAAVTAAALIGLDDLGSFTATVVAAPTVAAAPVTPRWVAPLGGALAGLGLALVLATTVPAGVPTGFTSRGHPVGQQVGQQVGP